MQAFKTNLIAAFALALGLTLTPPANAELIAISDDTKLVSLSSLRNGRSAITLVWPTGRLPHGAASQLMAGLASVMSGETTTRTPYQIGSFQLSKAIRHNINIVGQNLLLTVSAPEEFFPETLVHLENLLLDTTYSDSWYERELESISPAYSSKSKRPAVVLSEITNFLKYDPVETAAPAREGAFRFGRPSQIILRSEDKEAQRRMHRLLQKLPKADWEFPFAKWAETLSGDEKRPFALPNGVIHFTDPDSTEMLIMFVKAQEFETEDEQIGANLLMDYVGSSQGSEMFRIIRQEMRAAYNPHSEFVLVDKRKTIISLSAAVEATNWPEVHEKISEIYKQTRAGNVEKDGLALQHNTLKRRYYYDFATNPNWGAMQYVFEYPEGIVGDIKLPLFDALETASLDNATKNAQSLLPPLEDFLLILMGAGAVPEEIKDSGHYCALPKNTPLEFCLNSLSQVQY